MQRKRRLQEKNLRKERATRDPLATASARPAKIHKPSTEGGCDPSNKENYQPDPLTQEDTEGIQICTGFIMVKYNETGAPAKNNEEEIVMKLEYTHYSKEAFNDRVQDKEKSKLTICEQQKVIAEQKRLNESLQRDLNDERHECNTLKGKHNDFVSQCLKLGERKERGERWKLIPWSSLKKLKINWKLTTRV